MVIEHLDSCLVDEDHKLIRFQAHEHHRQYLQSLPSTTFPLEPTGARVEVNESQRVSDEPFGQR